MMERSPFSQRPLYLCGPANENGAAAPETPTAAAPTAAFFSSSRLSRRGSSLPLSSLVSGMRPPFKGRLAERSAGESGDEPIQERVVDEGQRNAWNQDRGHDPGPVEQVAADQIRRHADGESAVGRARDERDRVDELVHDEREREDDDGEDPGDRDREDDAHERAEPRAAVDERRVLELLRNRLEEAHQEPHGERNREGRVDEDQRPESVLEVQPRDNARERQEEQGRRHEVGEKDRDAQAAPDAARQPRERVAGRERDR